MTPTPSPQPRQHIVFTSPFGPGPGPDPPSLALPPDPPTKPLSRPATSAGDALSAPSRQPRFGSARSLSTAVPEQLRDPPEPRPEQEGSLPRKLPASSAGHRRNAPSTSSSASRQSPSPKRPFQRTAYRTFPSLALGGSSARGSTAAPGRSSPSGMRSATAPASGAPVGGFGAAPPMPALANGAANGGAPGPPSTASSITLANSAVLATGNAVSVTAQPFAAQSEAAVMHQHIHEVANKRIMTLDYLRKAHEGRVYWFNTLLHDRPYLAQMPSLHDPKKLARRATNFLLLGLSLPTVADINAGGGATACEFLKCLNALLAEFESFQQLHSESGGSSAGSLTRGRLPQMFRRATQQVPGNRSRRTASASLPSGSGADGGANGSSDAVGFPLDHALSADPLTGAGPDGAAVAAAAAAANGVISFAASESDLLPGEEYTYLLTPSLPFDPDFFETFATLCDVLIESCYSRLLTLLPTPRECPPPVADLFSKADSKIRKIIVQGVVKEFEYSSRVGVKAEVASVGRVVFSGLM